MSDISENSSSSGSDGKSQAAADETGSQSPAKGGQSFWAKLSRSLKRQSGVNLRADIADALMTATENNTLFSSNEIAMLHNILRFREVRVEDVMVPRADIEAVDQNTTIGELMIFFEESGRSRMPVYCDSLDDPRGMVHIRDLLSWVMKQARSKRRPPGKQPAASADGGDTGGQTIAQKQSTTRKARPGFDLGRVDLNKPLAETGIVRQLLFVPPSMPASDLMARMQASRIQMALVIDEYGGTDGLVSLEDIVEMVVGDIEDEHDDDEVMFRKTSDDIFIADARVELEELAEAIGPDFDIQEQIEDVDTLGGLIFSSLGRIPVRGEVVQALPGFEFHILEADPRRVKKVRITRKRVTSRRRPQTRSETDLEPVSATPAGPGKPDDLG